MSYEAYKSFYEKRGIRNEKDYNKYYKRYQELKEKHVKLKTPKRRELEWVDVPLRPYRKLPNKKEWETWVHIPTLSHWLWYMRYAKKMGYIFVDWVKPECYIDMMYRLFNKDQTVIKHWDFMEIGTLDEYKYLENPPYLFDVVPLNGDQLLSLQPSPSCLKRTTIDSEISSLMKLIEENSTQTTNWETNISQVNLLN